MRRFVVMAFLLLMSNSSSAADGLYSDLVKAAGTGDVATVRALLKQGIDPNVPSGTVSRSALGYAAFFKQVEVIKVLLAEGADVNARSRLGHTSLHEAVIAPGERGKLAIVKLLLENGADVNAEDKLGMTPLKHAEVDGLKEIVELLRKHGGR